MNEKRVEFEKLRKRWMKEHGWKGFVCARCGRFGKSTHLHHIQEVVYGGDNTPDNLIPLCGSCHREWDNYPEDYPFEQFLVTMPGKILCLTQELCDIEGAELFTTKAWLAFCGSVYRAVNMAKASEDMEEQGWFSHDLLYEQNQFFSRYPYSDEAWRRDMLNRVYGDIAPRLAKEVS